jgi:nicotinate-nucleotide adenylyltransferase
VLDLELSNATCSYTSDTLRRLHGEGFSGAELFFVTGADAFLDIATWKDYPALFDLANFAVVSRSGVSVQSLPDRLPELAVRMRHVATIADGALDGRTLIFLIDATTADVSSTAIRRARRDRRSIAGMVPVAVAQHIEQHDLYSDPTSAAPQRREPGDRSLDQEAGRLHGQD